MLTSNDSFSVLLVLAALVLIALVSVVFASSRSSRRRHEQLKQRFGAEYERAIVKYGSLARAERELMTREQRVKQLHLRDLASGARKRFSAHWEAVQSRFVDDPSGAVRAAHELVKQVMEARGYTLEDFDDRLAALSVEHASVVQHYRAARILAVANQAARANTEELRQAFVHYRVLFADLLAQPPRAQPGLKEVRI